ncbi:hypothetical protein OESDEN_16986 [Oesophagostomum dentatum]|uniref:Uncharacterized protein n=1 Tax=Oesophagostomum dentatum TaxID=61180 RepID=A0A0B1SIE8_OESDE|nr:hypothetical protein OESDEN_16986 [Oesophagostomum dentatum]
MLVLEPPLIKRSIDPLSIPRLIREPPLKRGDKRDSYIYPSTSSQLSDRIPLREPPLKRSGFENENQEVDLSRLSYLAEPDGRPSYLILRPASDELPANSQDILQERASVQRSPLSPSLLFPLRQLTPSASMRPLSLTRLWR